MKKMLALIGCTAVGVSAAVSPFTPSMVNSSASVYTDEYDELRVISPLSFGSISFDDMAYNNIAYNGNGVISPFIYTIPVDRDNCLINLTIQLADGALGLVAQSVVTTSDTIPTRFTTHKVGTTFDDLTAVSFSSMELSFGSIVSTDFLLSFGRVFDIIPYYSYRAENSVINVHYSVVATVITPNGLKETYAYVATFENGETIDLSYLTSSFREFLLQYPNSPCDLTGTTVTVASVDNSRFVGGFTATTLYPTSSDNYVTLRDVYSFNSSFFNYEFPITRTDGLLITAIADDVSAFFSIEIFPGFSFGTIGLIGLGGLILSFMLKFFLGG